MDESAREQPLLLYGDGLCVPDIAHAARFRPADPVAVLVGEELAIAVSDPNDKARARNANPGANVVTFEDLWEPTFSAARARGHDTEALLLGRFLDRLGCRSVRVPREFPVVLADDLRRRGVAVTPVSTEVRRRTKRPDEIDAIMAAEGAAECALSCAVDALGSAEPDSDDELWLGGRPLTAERLRWLIQVTLLERGCTTPEGVIVAPGLQAANPHETGFGPIHLGEAVVIDIYPQHESGYFADVARTVCRGAPTLPLRRMHEAVCAALDRAVRFVRPGVTPNEVQRLVEDVLTETGYRTLRAERESVALNETIPRLEHPVGHGVGLRLHELPTIAGNSGDDVFVVGDVFAIEPGLYHPMVGGVRLEDLVVVSEGGCRDLTRASRDFIL